MRDQLLDTVAMTTSPRIERRQVCLELVINALASALSGRSVVMVTSMSLGAAYSPVLPIVKPLAPLLSVIRNLKTNAVRVAKENRVVVGSVLRVKLRR